MVKNIKLIIFDLDGTLVDAYKPVVLSLNRALQQFGLPEVDAETVKRSVGWGDRNLMRRFVPRESVKKVLAVYRRHHRGDLRRGTKFLPGAKNLLKELKHRKYKLAIASNRPTRFTRIILRYLKAAGNFDCVLCADKVRRPKPAPDMLKGILRKFSLKPAEALYVGDMAIDVETGHRAKVKTIAVLTGSSTKKEILKLNPWRMIEHISEASQIIREFRS